MRRLSELSARCRDLLDQRWRALITAVSEGDPRPGATLSAELGEAIVASVNSRTKTYRYVLPTQLLAKVADPPLDCRCLQASRGGPGAFDARSVCQDVLVPFDRAHENVLGGSSEPYANNPVRVPEVSTSWRPAQRDKAGWDALCPVLGAVEEHQAPTFTLQALDRVLTEIYALLERTAVTYHVPQRVSHRN